MHFRRNSRPLAILCALLVSVSVSLGNQAEAVCIETPMIDTASLELPAATGPFLLPSDLKEISKAATSSAPITIAPAPTEAPTDTPDATPVITIAEAPTPAEQSAETPTKILPDVPIEAELQQALLSGPCEGNLSRFCLIVAMGDRESDYDFDKVGDNGRSFGWLQIQRRFHTQRIEDLGITDLSDPIQNATVALSYLGELAATQNLTLDDIPTHYLLMQYNAGPGGAAKMARKGISSTDYSREVLDNYNLFMTELGLF